MGAVFCFFADTLIYTRVSMFKVICWNRRKLNKGGVEFTEHLKDFLFFKIHAALGAL